MLLSFLGFEIGQSPIFGGLPDLCHFWSSCTNFSTFFGGGLIQCELFLELLNFCI